MFVRRAKSPLQMPKNNSVFFYSRLNARSLGRTDQAIFSEKNWVIMRGVIYGS
ncbi:MAG: hypothetical protein AAGI90_01250 [Chlamydiota bacterium]